MNEVELNQQVADRICRDFEFNEQKFAIGDCVAILNGEVVAITTSLDEALEKLRSIDPDPTHGMLLEVRSPVMDVVR